MPACKVQAGNQNLLLFTPAGSQDQITPDEGPLPSLVRPASSFFQFPP